MAPQQLPHDAGLKPQEWLTLFIFVLQGLQGQAQQGTNRDLYLCFRPGLSLARNPFDKSPKLPRIALSRETISAMPPYCALWGFWCLNMANWVRYPLPFF